MAVLFFASFSQPHLAPPPVPCLFVFVIVPRDETLHAPPNQAPSGARRWIAGAAAGKGQEGRDVDGARGALRRAQVHIHGHRGGGGGGQHSVMCGPLSFLWSLADSRVLMLS